MTLQEVYDRFIEIPFPDSSPTSEELAEIHAELIMYDMYVASAIDYVLHGDSCCPTFQT